MGILKLSNYEVELKDELSWYDTEEIKAEMINEVKMNNTGVTGISGTGLLKAKLKTFEKLILSIKKGDEVIKYSEEWVKGLSKADGELLNGAVDNVDGKKN
jgi:hypothetical protein